MNFHLLCASKSREALAALPLLGGQGRADQVLTGQLSGGYQVKCKKEAKIKLVRLGITVSTPGPCQ